MRPVTISCFSIEVKHTGMHGLEMQEHMGRMWCIGLPLCHQSCSAEGRKSVLAAHSDLSVSLVGLARVLIISQ